MLFRRNDHCQNINKPIEYSGDGDGEYDNDSSDKSTMAAVKYRDPVMAVTPAKQRIRSGYTALQKQGLLENFDIEGEPAGPN